MIKLPKYHMMMLLCLPVLQHMDILCASLSMTVDEQVKEKYRSAAFSLHVEGN